MIIYLDLDGVIVDLVQGILNKERITHFHWPEGDYDIEKVIGIKLKSLSQEFWATLPMTMEAIEILNLVCKHKDTSQVVLCSSPCSHECAAGKWQWWKNSQFAGFPLILTDTKWVLATRDSLLIDDSDTQCTLFWQCYGSTLLVPRPWNSQHDLDTMSTIKEYFNGKFRMLKDTRQSAEADCSGEKS